MSAVLAPLPRLSARTLRALRQARAHLRNREPLTPVQWAARHRMLSPEGSARPGRFRFEFTPYLTGILEAYTDPSVREIWCQKSAQIGWTDGFMNNLIGYHVDQDPCPILVVFSKDGAAKDYTREKLEPMIRANPRLAARIPLTARSASGSLFHKSFTGGFLKLAGSNSPSGVKSTPVRLAMVEEPDDTSADVRGQGDSISLAKERTKTYPNSKIVVGGTPTLKGFSKIESGLLVSDQRRFYVPCHHCGDAEPLAWENVRWAESDTVAAHPVYGAAQPESARYYCPHCGGEWGNDDKNRNVQRGQWRATAPFSGIAGFKLSELYSSFPKSGLTDLVRKFLEAVHEQRQGKVGKLIAFFNSTLGESWELKGDTPELPLLQERALNYNEWTAPSGGLIATAGVDVQHDRLAVCVWLWGRGEESWLAYWGEIHGTVSCLPTDGVWKDLAALLDRLIATPAGAVPIKAVSVDSGDGATSDWVYGFVRQQAKRRKRTIMAVKGSGQAAREIYSAPRVKLDTLNTGKASKWGLQLHHVGVDRAKDVLMERLRAPGYGPGRMHWYSGVREDFLVQMTSEVKAPMPGKRRVGWQKKSGVRNEALDCTVYALHAARRLRVHVMTETEWTGLEMGLRQPSLLTPQERPVVAIEPPKPADVPRGTPVRMAPSAPIARDEWSSRL